MERRPVTLQSSRGRVPVFAFALVFVVSLLGPMGSVRAAGPTLDIRGGCDRLTVTGTGFESGGIVHLFVGEATSREAAELPPGPIEVGADGSFVIEVWPDLVSRCTEGVAYVFTATGNERGAEPIVRTDPYTPAPLPGAAGSAGTRATTSERWAPWLAGALLVILLVSGRRATRSG